MNVGQKLLSENSLVKFGITPTLGGTIAGTAYGVHDKVTNPYADRDTVKDHAILGAVVGVGIGGASATTFRAFRDFSLKQSIYTNAALAKSKGGGGSMAHSIVHGGASVT